MSKKLADKKYQTLSKADQLNCRSHTENGNEASQLSTKLENHFIENDLAENTTVHLKIDAADRKVRMKDNSLLNEVMTAVNKMGIDIRVVFCPEEMMKVTLTGNKSRIAEASEIVIQKLEAQKRLKFPIETKYLSRLVGKDGKKVQEIMHKTRTKIRVDFEEKSVTIIGTKESVDEARTEIIEFLDRLIKSEKLVVKIPVRYQIFFRVAFAKEMSELFSDEGSCMKIRFPTLKSSDEVTLIGKAVTLERAEKFINSRIKQIEGDYLEANIVVPKYTHRILLLDQTVDSILRETGVLVTIPSINDSNNQVNFYGQSSKIREAVMMILMKCESIVQRQIKTPNWLQKLLKGWNKENFNKIKQKYPNVFIKCEEETEVIVVEGESEYAEDVYNILSNLINDLLMNIIKISLSIDAKFTSLIIGKHGSKINSLKEETKTYIYVDSIDKKNVDESNSDSVHAYSSSDKHVINIVGTKENVGMAKARIMETLSYLKDMKSHDYFLHSCYHKFIFGHRGEAIRQLREKLNNEVNFHFSYENNLVTLKGPTKWVEKAIEYLDKEKEQLSKEHFRREVSIPASDHTLLFGRNRIFLKEVKEITGVSSIFLPKYEDNKGSIVIIGNEDSVNSACELIEKRYREICSFTKISVQIPRVMHEYFINRKETDSEGFLNELLIKKKKVSIEFPSADSQTEDVIIMGDSKYLAAVKKQLLKKVEEIRPNYHTDFIRVKPEFHGWIIGKKGSKVTQICSQHNTKINFPGADSIDPELITIIGKKEDVEQVKQILAEIVSKVQNSTTTEIEITPLMHFILTHRQNDSNQITALINKFPSLVIYSFPASRVKPSPSFKISVSGPKKQVEDCVKIINTTLQKFEKHEKDVIDVLVDQFKILAMDRNRLMNEISTKRSVIITRSYDNWTGDKKAGSEQSATSSEETDILTVDTSVDKISIKIVGLPDSVKRAKSDIISIDPVVKTLEIPMNLHGPLIGQKGSEIKSILGGLSVKVKFPTTENPSDTIELYGNKKDVLVAQRRLEDRIKQIQEKSYTIEVEMNKKWLPRFIGRKGANVDKLKQTYDVIISTHTNKTEKLEDDNLRESVEFVTIVVIGSKENCEKVEDDIKNQISIWDSMITRNVAIPSEVKGKVIGTKWKNIKHLSLQYNVSISLLDPNIENSPMEIVGAKNDVLACVDRIEATVHDLMKEMEEEFELVVKHPSSHNRSLIDIDNTTTVPGSIRSSFSKNSPSLGSMSFEADDALNGDVEIFPTLDQSLQQLSLQSSNVSSNKTHNKLI